MKKTLLTLVLTPFLMLKATSQPKQADSVVCSKVSDLRLIIESNEKGKAAQAKLPIMQEKVVALERSVGLYSQLVATKDSNLRDLSRQVILLGVVNDNNRLIISNQTQQLTEVTKRLNAEVKSHRATRRKLVFVGITGILASFVTFYIAAR